MSCAVTCTSFMLLYPTLLSAPHDDFFMYSYESALQPLCDSCCYFEVSKAAVILHMEIENSLFPTQWSSGTVGLEGCGCQAGGMTRNSLLARFLPPD